VAQNAPQTVILSGDEAWMYLQATTMSVWSPVGETPLVRIDPGRAKVSFYGTLDLRTGRELVSRSQDLTASASAAHLRLILDTFRTVPIRLFWDRAPWHRGEAIRTLLAAHPRLEIIDYPVAAPELNPQEQVWKQSRRAISHNHVRPKLPQLADDFEQPLTGNTFHSSFLHDYGFDLVCPFWN
jgi:DDE superfamily endonuclease